MKRVTLTLTKGFICERRVKTITGIVKSAEELRACEEVLLHGAQMKCQRWK